jgi:N-acetyl-gamma-glutamyl-phosphate reductase
MVRVVIVGASGYTGVELLRLLVQHPEVRITAVTSEQSAGKRVDSLFSSLAGQIDLVFEPLDLEVLSHKADFFFLALPHTTAMPVASWLIRKGKKVVDLSADFRLKDPDLYQQWYKIAHTDTDLLRSAVYGLPELHREAIQKASLIANPGCYPTGTLLGLLPLLKESLIHYDGIVIDAKSGVSGAGRSVALTYHFPEVNESVFPYSVACHRHQPEIEQELSAAVHHPVQVTFTPQLVPMTRGILTTLYARTKKPINPAGWVKAAEKFYKGKPFIHILPPGHWPNTRDVRGSNACHIGMTTDTRTGLVIVATAIDNLMKGASGQAVQNMNLMMGLDETLGLQSSALFP